MSYSASVQAEVYFKGLVQGHSPLEAGRMKGGSGPRAGSGGGGVRLVKEDEGDGGAFERMRRSGESGRGGG